MILMEGIALLSSVQSSTVLKHSKHITEADAIFNTVNTLNQSKPIPKPILPITIYTLMMLLSGKSGLFDEVDQIYNEFIFVNPENISIYIIK
jgi:hypothetical protein